MIKLYKEFTPTVSIILPTFNRINYLLTAIESVRNQTFSNWELLVIDDGSDDGTFDLIKKYQDYHINIRYSRHSNRKLPITLNAGLLMATGEYVTFLGSDDKYKPDHLKLRFDFMKKNSDVDLIHGGVDIVGDPYVKDKNNLNKLIHLSECVIGGTFFGKRELFLELDGFNNIHYSEDSDFYERARGNYNIQKIDFPTYVYNRDTPDSICNLIK
jgi:glycosyltransferase involved in cell wall biosynthesis